MTVATGEEVREPKTYIWLVAMTAKPLDYTCLSSPMNLPTTRIHFLQNCFMYLILRRWSTVYCILDILWYRVTAGSNIVVTKTLCC